MDKIIKNLEKRKKALEKQLFELPEDPQSNEEEIFAAEVVAKLDLVNELLQKFG